MYDLIIIGGGPAGITAAIYAIRKKINTLVISKDFLGQVGKTAEVGNYPGFKSISGIELMKRFKEHLDKFNVKTKEGKKVIEIKKIEGGFQIETGDREKFKTKTIIVATGRDPRPLEVPGEKKFIGKGVSYCVTCDGPLFEGKPVAVIGGGNSGFEGALELSEYCPEVFILEYKAEVKADELIQERAKNKDNVKIITEAELKRIEGDKSVEKIIYKDRESKEERILEVEGVFVEIGSIPATSFVKSLVEFNKRDEIKIDPRTCATSTPAILAAGDVTNIRDKQIVTATGEGAKAAISAYKYLREKK